MRNLSGMVLTVVLGLAACSDSNDDDDMTSEPPPPPPANTTTLDVALAAEQVVGGGATAGSATAEVTVDLDDGSLSGTVTVSGITADGVTLNRAFAGDRGAVLVTLEASGSDWVFPGSVALSADEIDAFERGELYLLATTEAEPEGALRGQLLPEGIRLLQVALSGAQEVPPVTTSASAQGAVTLADGGDVVVHVNTAGLDDAVESHIHEALAGVNGPIFTGLVQDPDDVSHWMLEDFVLDEAGQMALDAGALYLNVHTPANPPGEVRGQIEPDGVDVFFASLTGDDVVPPVASDASGVAAGTLDTDEQTLDLHVNLQEADDATAVSVNQAPLMQNGPVVLSLTQDPDALGHWFVDAVTLSDAQSQALQNQGLYVVVETPDFPDGELRAQLAPDDSMAGGGDAFTVASIDPGDGATVDSLPEQVTATFNRELLASTATTESVTVAASGGDGSFADGNEMMIEVLGVTVNGSELVADLDTSGAGDDVYQVTLDGSSGAPLTDQDGVALDGDADGNPGGDFASTFTVDAASSAPTLSLLQADIFSPSCAVSGCHTGASPPQGLNLSAGQTFANVVDVPANEVPSLDRVEPGDPDASYLVRKVEGTASVGGQMPLGGAPLSNAQMQAIRDWITAGAEDN